MSGAVGALDALLEPGEVVRHLCACLSPNDERYQKPSDAMAFEVDCDREARPLVTQLLDGEVDTGADRPVDAAHRPGAWRVETDQL